MYIRGCKGIRATTININKSKKEVINPFNFFPNYFQYLSSVVDLFKLYSIYTKPRYK